MRGRTFRLSWGSLLLNLGATVDKLSLVATCGRTSELAVQEKDRWDCSASEKSVLFLKEVGNFC